MGWDTNGKAPDDDGPPRLATDVLWTVLTLVLWTAAIGGVALVIKLTFFG